MDRTMQRQVILRPMRGIFCILFNSSGVYYSKYRAAAALSRPLMVQLDCRCDGAPFLMADVGRRANERRNRDGAKTVDGAVLTLASGAPLLMEMSAVIDVDVGRDERSCR
jgi:hypothetical protein